MIHENLSNKSLLVYDSFMKQWVSKSFDEFFPIFSGATESLPGIPGFVPAAQSGANNRFLRNDGEWIEIEEKAENIFVTENSKNLEHNILIQQFTSKKQIRKGDIIIIKDLISGDIYQHTAYVFDGENWQAFEGNYNAKNVYFNKDFILTDSIGAIEVPEGKTVNLNLTGKNMEQFIQLLVNKDKKPNIIYPVVEIKCSAAKAYEVGEIVTPKYQIIFEDGQYEYGTIASTSKAAGTTISNISVTDGIQTLKTLFGTFDKIVIKDDINQRILATVKYSDGLIPLTLLGEEYPQGQIKESTINLKTSAFTGYRSFFYGMTTSSEEINSILIRSLYNGGPYNEEKKIVLKANKKNTRSIIAIPANSSRKGPVSVTLTSGFQASILNEYKKLQNTIPVEGLNGYDPIEYEVWVYEPLAGIGADEIHEIILG